MGALLRRDFEVCRDRRLHRSGLPLRTPSPVGGGEREQSPPRSYNSSRLRARSVQSPSEMAAFRRNFRKTSSNIAFLLRPRPRANIDLET